MNCRLKAVDVSNKYPDFFINVEERYVIHDTHNE
jgi:hypothetical protein